MIWIPNSLFHQNNPPRPSYVPPCPPAPSQVAPPNNPAPRTIFGACFRCGQPGHYSHDCPIIQNAPHHAKGNPNVRAKPTPKVSTAKPSTTTNLGRVNQISAEETVDTFDVILGTLPVNHVPSSVLFDPGASHSFMSESYALRHEFAFEEMFSPMIIQTHGSKWQTNRVSHGNQIAIEGLVFLASLIALKSSDIDVILGMDWLSR